MSSRRSTYAPCRRRLSVMPRSRAIVADVRVAELRHLGAQAVDLGHHEAPALDLGERQIFGIGRVDLAADALGRAPGKQHLAVADGAEEPAAARERALDVADAAHAEPEPRQHALVLVRAAGGGEDVAVAGRVDDDLGADREAPALALERDGVRCASPRRGRVAAGRDDGLAGPGVEQQPHARAGRPSRSARGAAPRDRTRPSSARGAAGAPDEAPAPVALDRRRVVAAPLRRAAGRRRAPRAASRSVISWQSPRTTCRPSPSSSVSSRMMRPPVARPPSAP